MADDIVARLRDTAYETDVCWEAAGEIERLRVAGYVLATALRTGRGTDAALAAWEALRT